MPIATHPVLKFFLFGYFLCLMIGWFLLRLPFFHHGSITDLDILFTISSAISTTGLSTIDLGTALSLPGQWILLFLIQCGGIGYMILTTYIVLYLEQPNGVTTKKIINQVLLFTATIEMAGCIILYILFYQAEVDHPFWNALFHTISAFCTAGFSLFPTNFEAYQNGVGVSSTLSILSLLGGFGIFLWIGKGLNVSVIKRMGALYIAVMSLIGAACFLAGGSHSHTSFLLPSFFQAISAISTAGFNTIDMQTLMDVQSYVLIVLMLTGAALTGNGISLKRSTLISFMIYTLLLLLSVFLLLQFEKGPYLPFLFECASALCTVGLSLGTSVSVSSLGKSVLVLLMLVGRLSVLILGFVLSTRIALKKERTDSPSHFDIS